MAALFALMSSLQWGTADFLAGTASRRKPVIAVYGGSQAIGLVAFAVVALVIGAWRADTGYVGWGALAGVLGMAGLLAFYTALATGRMGIVAPVTALGVLAPLIVGLARGDAPTQVQVLGIVLGVGGAVLASGPELSDEGGSRPVLLALLAAALLGACLIAASEGSRSSAVMTTVMMRVTTVAIVAVIAIARRSIGGLERGDVPTLAVIGIFDAGANVTWGIASTLGLLSVTGVLSSLYPVVTVALAATVHRERLRGVQYAGVTAALAGVALIGVGA